MNIAPTIPLAATWMHGGWGWGWMSLMMVMMVLFWGAIIFGVVWLIRGAARDGSAPREGAAGKESAVEILERRFAEGEIREEDYRARRAVLVGGGTAGADGARKDQLLTAP
jgi:putative membrane protein